MVTALPVVDTHVHLWDTRKLRYPWLADLPRLDRPHLLEEYREATRDLAVEAMVFMQCEADPAQALQEAEWVAALARGEPRLKGIIPWAPLEEGEGARPYLERLARLPGIKGVRRIIQYEPDPEFCLRPEFVRGVQLLAEFGWSFDLCISHVHLENTIELVRRCPGVSFVLDHVGKPNIKERVWQPWAAGLARLARLANVACKVSGMVTEDDHDSWKREDLKPYIDHVLECFGFDRVMFGGDWPVVTLAASYPQWAEALEWALEGCTPAERSRLYRDNALRIYRLGTGGRQ